MPEETHNLLSERPLLVPSCLAAFVLFAALGNWPYGYFVFLRWVTFIAAIVVVVGAHNRKQSWALWLFAAIAILFNPLVPVHLSQEIWRPIDIGAGIIFLVAGFTLRTLAPNGPYSKNPR